MASSHLAVRAHESGTVTEADQRMVASAVERDGFAVVEVDAAGKDPLLVLADALGRRQLHPRGNRLGIIGSIVGDGDGDGQEISPAWRDHIDEYQAVGLKDLGCHTDGSFMDGPGVGPPALLGLHCAKPADAGGESLLVDGGSLFEAVRRADPGLLRELCRPQFTFCRDELLAVDQPVFRHRHSAAVSIRWRFDKAVYGTKRALEALCAFHDIYVSRAAPRRGRAPGRANPGHRQPEDAPRPETGTRPADAPAGVDRRRAARAGGQPRRPGHTPRAYQLFDFYQPLPDGRRQAPPAMTLGAKVALDVIPAVPQG
ncbi:hypothetical protein GCM10020000_04770 [Streptomyces olivoverticillatus]